MIKHTAKKIRRLYQDKILAGFAGSTADAFTLFSRFEAKLEQYHGNLGRAAVELAKDWRTDKFLRHLEALLLVSDKEQTFLLSGQGDVIEPDGGIAAIGSGGPYAQAAAQALAEHTQLSARQIAEEAMKIAGKMCIYTNDKVTIEELLSADVGTSGPRTLSDVLPRSDARESELLILWPFIYPQPPKKNRSRSTNSRRARSSPNSTSTLSARKTPSAPSPLRCATACAGRSSRLTWPKKSFPKTSS